MLESVEAARAAPDEIQRLKAAAAQAGRAGLVVLALRIAGAGLAYLTQVALARLMGATEYGLFATTWVWIAILGHGALFGLSQTTCRFPPSYLARGQADLARGFLRAGLVFVLGASLAVAMGWASAIGLLGLWREPAAHAAMLLAALVVPVFALQDYAESVARAFGRPVLAIAPPYVLRQALIPVLLALAVWSGAPAQAPMAIVATLMATSLAVCVQGALVIRAVRAALPAGPRAYRPRTWIGASLPVAFVDFTTLLVSYADVLVLSLFAPPEAVAVYFAATRLIQFIAFVGYAASAATAPRLAEAHARGDRRELLHLVRRATLWTTLAAFGGGVAVVAASPLLLGLFGPGFSAAIPLVAIMGAGLVVQAAMGPAEDVLTMLGQERACALGSVGALFVAIGGAGLLTPLYGVLGAAIAAGIASASRGAILAWFAWRRLGVRTVLRWPRREMEEGA